MIFKSSPGNAQFLVLVLGLAVRLSDDEYEDLLYELVLVRDRTGEHSKGYLIGIQDRHRDLPALRWDAVTDTSGKRTSKYSVRIQ